MREIDRFTTIDSSITDLNVSITFETTEKSYTIYKKNIVADTTNFRYYNSSTHTEEIINNNNLDSYLQKRYNTGPVGLPNIQSQHRVLLNTFVNGISHNYNTFDEDFGTLETVTESNKFIRAYTLTLNNEYNKKYKIVLDFVHKYETAQNTSKICSMFNTSDYRERSVIPDCIPTCYGNMYSYEINRNYNNENLQSFTITLKDWDDGDNYEHDVNVKDFFIYKGTVNDENYDCYAYIMIEEINGISQKYLIGIIDSIDSLGLKTIGR